MDKLLSILKELNTVQHLDILECFEFVVDL